jgi:glycosyl transferase family 25
MENIDKIYIINLDKDVERLSNSYKQLKKYDINNYERYPAVYGKILTNEEINNITTKIGKLFASNSMIGCGKSHINIWNKIIENGYNKTLILEDDFILIDNFLTKFDNIIKKAPEEYDILFLSSNIIHNKNLKLYDIDDYFYKQLLISQTVGYIITFEGANKILKYLNKISYHIDVELCILSLIHNFNIISVKEALIYQIFDNSNNTDNREYPLIIDKLLIRNDINYLYKTILFSIKSLNINISINTIIIFIFGYYIYLYAIILLLFEYLYKSNNMIFNNLLLLSIGFLFKAYFMKPLNKFDKK